MTKKSKPAKSKNLLGKRESSILLFIIIMACLVFSSWGKSSSVQDTSSGKALIGGAFELTDQNGKAFSSEQLKGKKSLVFFGFTNCPSVCPTAMAQISALMEKLDTSKVQPVFITVDPQRDKPEVIKAFLKNYYAGFIGLTGSPEQLKAVEKAYKIYSAKTDENANYNMDHSSLIYVMDANGEYLTHFSGHETEEEMVAKIVDGQ